MSLFESLAEKSYLKVDSEEFAEFLDRNDKLRALRAEFFYPRMKEMPLVDLNLVNGESDALYFCGNSLGLQPKGVKKYIDAELEKWAHMGVHGHLNGKYPWAHGDEFLLEGSAKIVGAKTKEEVAVMNGLTVNLHLLMVSFYVPTAKRYKILLESQAFPSDHYAVESQIKFHGLDPKNAMICLSPRKGEYTLRTEDILEVIQQQGEEIALILFSGLQYYTGQLFDIPAITKAGHEQGCIVGWDLAHAAGNVPLKLHDWDVDFAAWCSYKYLNTGAGGIAGAFVHEKHFQSPRPRFQGWWGHRFETRFQMNNQMDAAEGAAGWRISNPSMLLVCPMLASLDVFAQTSMEALREKSILLTGYLEFCIRRHFALDSPHRVTESYCEIITPSNPEERGCQLSISFSVDLHHIFEELQRRGVACDKRLPYVLRITPVHLYNSFHDCWRLIGALRDSLQACEKK